METVPRGSEAVSDSQRSFSLYHITGSWGLKGSGPITHARTRVRGSQRSLTVTYTLAATLPTNLVAALK